MFQNAGFLTHSPWKSHLNHGIWNLVESQRATFTKAIDHMSDNFTLFSHVHDKYSGRGSAGWENGFSWWMSKNLLFEACHNLPFYLLSHIAIHLRVLYTKQNLIPPTFSRQKDFKISQHKRKLRGGVKIPVVLRPPCTIVLLLCFGC